jgi:hypothetical protein
MFHPIGGQPEKMTQSTAERVYKNVAPVQLTMKMSLFGDTDEDLAADQKTLWNQKKIVEQKIFPRATLSLTVCTVDTIYLLKSFKKCRETVGPFLRPQIS